LLATKWSSELKLLYPIEKERERHGEREFSLHLTQSASWSSCFDAVLNNIYELAKWLPSQAETSSEAELEP